MCLPDGCLGPPEGYPHLPPDLSAPLVLLLAAMNDNGDDAGLIRSFPIPMGWIRRPCGPPLGL